LCSDKDKTGKLCVQNTVMDAARKQRLFEDYDDSAAYEQIFRFYMGIQLPRVSDVHDR